MRTRGHKRKVKVSAEWLWEGKTGCQLQYGEEAASTEAETDGYFFPKIHFCGFL